MQLNNKRNIASAVAAITAALLGSGISAATNGSVESSALLYSEIGRVSAGEGVIKYNRNLPAGRIFGVKLTLDGLTGASPNGATPSRKIQTFTSPSGRSGYSIPSGQLPLDNTFQDRRVAIDLDLSQPLGRLSSVSIGGHFSNEHDYLSAGLSGALTRDFNDKNTTVGISGSYSHDVVTLMGGYHSPLGVVPLAQGGGEAEGDGEGEGEGESETPKDHRSKNVFDVMASITQVINRSTLLRFNYSLDRSSGYLNDPYKLLSVVADVSSPDAGEPLDYVYEGRPDNRTKQAIYGQVRHYFSGNVVDISYRYFHDDWGVHSQTVDFFYRFQLKGDHALQPHMRWYRQNASDFYSPFLVAGTTLPKYASADIRLAPFDAYTFGLQYLFPVGEAVHLSIGAEYYTQRGDRSPPGVFGTLKNLNLFPAMNALMLRVGFNRDL